MTPDNDEFHSDDKNSESFFDEFKEKMAIDPLQDSVHHVRKKVGKAQTITIVILVVVAIAAGLGWNIYNSNLGRQASLGEVPLLKADSEPDKVRPETAGGMQVDDMDKSVYGRLDGASGSEGYEKILPAAERPVSPKVQQSDDPLADMIAEINAEEVPAPAPVPAAAPAPVTNAAKAPAVSAPASAGPKTVSKAVAKGNIAPKPTAAPSGKVTVTVTEEEVIETVNVPSDIAASGKSVPVAGKVVSKTVTKTVEASAALTPYRVQIVSSKDKAAVEKTWKRLKAKYGDLLADYDYEIISADVAGKGTFYRLRVLGFESRDEAQSLCAALKSRGQDCLVTSK